MCSNCFVSSVYRIYVVALGSDPQYGDSPPSNVLTVCTPVVQESIMRRRPSGGVIRPPFDVTVNVLSTSNTSISIEWTHPTEIGNERRKKLKYGTCHLRPCTNYHFFSAREASDKVRSRSCTGTGHPSVPNSSIQ